MSGSKKKFQKEILKKAITETKKEQGSEQFIECAAVGRQKVPAKVADFGHLCTHFIDGILYGPFCSAEFAVSGVFFFDAFDEGGDLVSGLDEAAQILFLTGVFAHFRKEDTAVGLLQVFRKKDLPSLLLK